MANLPKFRPVMLNAPGKPALRALVRPAAAPAPPRRRIPSPLPPPAIRKRTSREESTSTYARDDEFRGSLEPRTIRHRAAQESYDETMTAVRPVDPDLLRVSQETAAYDSVTNLRADAPTSVPESETTRRQGRREQSGASVVTSLPPETLYRSDRTQTGSRYSVLLRIPLPNAKLS